MDTLLLQKNCNVASAERNNTSLIAVVLGAEGNAVWSDTHLLLDYGFENFKSSKIASQNEYVEQIPVHNGDRPDVAAIIPKDLYALVSIQDVGKIQKELVVATALEAPVSKGVAVGEMIYTLDGLEIGRSPIVVVTDVKLVKSLTADAPITFWKVVLLVLISVVVLLFARIGYQLLCYRIKKLEKKK